MATVNKYLRLDIEAVQLLREIAPDVLKQGSYLSELVRRDVALRHALREQREALRQAQCRVCGEAGQ